MFGWFRRKKGSTVTKDAGVSRPMSEVEAEWLMRKFGEWMVKSQPAWITTTDHVPWPIRRLVAACRIRIQQLERLKRENEVDFERKGLGKVLMASQSMLVRFSFDFLKIDPADRPLVDEI